LSTYYPEALKVTRYGDRPVPVDPVTLAKNLGFAIMRHNIREDGSVYGQIYFSDSDVELFDEMSGDTVTVHVPKNTIVIDPKTCLFRNIGCENNSIVHECVHGVKHRKVFELERLYNASAYNISCEVVGGAESAVLRTATETMERQANQLAPRIQMPEGPFRAKASEYIGRFMREKNTDRPNEVMEAVIIQLQSDFLVSRQAAKIRMVELGFEEAIGTFTYLDEHYVKPHCFRKGSIKWNQTFSISAQDAAIERFINPELRELTKNGDYLFVDNHYVYNAPLYVRKDEYGGLELTEYALSHMDECCLVFDMKIIGGIETDYHTACYLNRDRSNVTFEVKFHNGFENSPQARQIAMRKKQAEEEMEIRKQMTDDPAQCLALLLRWRKKKHTELADYIDINPKTLSRVINGKNVPKFETAVMICFGLNLPPLISEKFLAVCNCPLQPTNQQHQWIHEALNIKYPESLENICRYLHMYGVTILPVKNFIRQRDIQCQLIKHRNNEHSFTK
jgi:DNA-binding XRE family transcriptional regulator